MGLTADIGLGRFMLGIERVEVLFEPMIGRDPGVDRAANRLGGPGLHVRTSAGTLLRTPKNLGPLQRVPVIAWATSDRLR